MRWNCRQQAGWNQTIEDWRLLIDLSPEGCFAIAVGGELAATTTLIHYGRRLAWIGMVLTKESYRGRGFAKRLLSKALSHADQLGIETVKLDATDQGQPIYENMGFRCEQPVERWSRRASADVGVTMPRVDVLLPEDCRTADQHAFGVGRSELLQRLGRRGVSQFNGTSYMMTRPGRDSDYLGPSVCDVPEVARKLVEQALNSGKDRAVVMGSASSELQRSGDRPRSWIQPHTTPATHGAGQGFARPGSADLCNCRF